jgi:hypothetical protein
VLTLINKEEPIVARPVQAMDSCISNRGKEFPNILLKELFKLINDSKYGVTAYHPMVNGHVKPFNRGIRKYLMTMLDETADWVAFLKPLQIAHNTAISKLTHFNPHF